MKKICQSMLFILVMMVAFSGVAQTDTVKVNFNAAEAESMLFLFNQTMIKGSDVKVLAPLQTKLNDALDRAREVEDPKDPVPLELSQQEAQICVQIISNAEFEAKYSELVLGMMNKIKESLPAPTPPVVPAQ
ncbi:hypothetical protein GF406_18455 [candidate division KSB1 bacterium]|nr:hypothetical protein [candidate division KSB1 bacterium]